jgi:hypothetical protein
MPAAPDPKSGVSANSTTLAFMLFYNIKKEWYIPRSDRVSTGIVSIFGCLCQCEGMGLIDQITAF